LERGKNLEGFKEKVVPRGGVSEDKYGCTSGWVKEEGMIVIKKNAGWKKMSWDVTMGERDKKIPPKNMGRREPAANCT